MKRVSILSALALCLVAGAAEDFVIDDFGNANGWVCKTAPGAVEAEPASGPEGAPVLKVKMPGTVSKTHGKYWFPTDGKTDLNGFKGVSFWIKGDGSANWGSLTLSDRYDYAYTFRFPLKEREWHKVSASWDDFVPQGPYGAIGGKTELPPCGLVNVQFGDSWKVTCNNKTISPYEFHVAGLRFDGAVDLKTRPDFSAPPLRRTLGKLERKEPFKVLCLGDSITVGIGLKDMESSRYAKLLETKLRNAFGYDGITVESRAVGGSDTVCARTWLERDFEGSRPDLVIIHYGYNDKSRKFPTAFFKDSMRDYMGRISAKTGGGASFLLLSTIPGLGPRRHMLDGYAHAVKELAQETGVSCLDLHAVFANPGNGKMEDLYADIAHPNEKGHELMAESVFRRLESELKAN